MKMSYDPKADALYIRLRKARIEESDEIAEGIDRKSTRLNSSH